MDFTSIVTIAGWSKSAYAYYNKYQNWKNPDMSNREQLRAIENHFHNIEEQLKTMRLEIRSSFGNLDSFLDMKDYVETESTIKNAVEEIQLLASTNNTLSSSYSQEYWSIKTDKLKQVISFYLDGINGDNFHGGDILKAIQQLSQGRAYQIDEIVNKSVAALVNSGIQAYSFFCKMEQLSFRDEQNRRMKNEYKNKERESIQLKYNKATDRTLQFELIALTDFTSVKSEVTALLDENVMKMKDFEPAVKKIYEFLCKKYGNSFNDQLPKVKWLVIGCSNILYDDAIWWSLAFEHKCYRVTKLLENEEFVRDVKPNISCMVLPFFDAELKPFDESLQSWIQQIVDEPKDDDIPRFLTYLFPWLAADLLRDSCRVAKTIGEKINSRRQLNGQRPCLILQWDYLILLRPSDREGSYQYVHRIPMNVFVEDAKNLLGFQRKRYGRYDIFVF